MKGLVTLKKAWKVPDIRRKMIFTLLMLIIFRIGSYIPVPGIDRTVLEQLTSDTSGLMGFFNLFSGGSFSNMTVFALVLHHISRHLS